ncbi:hypothetical protein AC579_10363 [Pseudocercospora musae]|uniref:Uncharacterized protein n=1 Tax=Pseudocercospora musae TaxID=113226 RepID=A0A139ICR2_9PEZI|nr:hypothetical protein AC579_10363 [Pseudocercospora musae]
MLIIVTIAATMLLGASSVSCDEMSPAASILAQALEDMAAYDTPSPPAIQPAPVEGPSGNCNPSQERCGLTSDTRPNCEKKEDCYAYCENLLGRKEGTLVNCAGNFDPQHPETPVEEICSCYNADGLVDIVSDVIVAIGEVTCYTWVHGLAVTEDSLQVISKIPLPQFKAMGYVGKAMRVGNKIYAEGAKMGKCPNSFCPGYKFTVIDVEKLGEELGLLDRC